MTFLSVLRTNAPPLPGLTCWKSTTFHSWPSRLRVMPFLRSLLVATGAVSCVGSYGARPRGAPSGLEDEQFLGGPGEQLGTVGADDERVLDADTPASRQVDPRLDGDRHPVS